MTNEILTKIIWDLFVNRSDCYAEQLEKGYAARKEPLTLELIQQHLDGAITIGVYQLSHDEVVWGCLDFDLNTIDDFENAKRVYSYLVEQGIHPLLEMSGGGEYKCHVWVFSNAKAWHMQSYLKEICNKINVHPHEIFPKQVSVKEGDFGNLVKLPLGVHQKTKRRSYFLDSNFNKIESEEDIIKKLREYF